MNSEKEKIEQYFSRFSPDVQKKLEKIRTVIRKAVPEAEEGMSYGVPAFKMNGNSVLYAAFKNHIGFYPTPTVIKAFKKELAGYEVSKGTIKIPFDQPVPYDLIEKMTRYQLEKV